MLRWTIGQLFADAAPARAASMRSSFIDKSCMAVLGRLKTPPNRGQQSAKNLVEKRLGVPRPGRNEKEPIVSFPDVGKHCGVVSLFAEGADKGAQQRMGSGHSDSPKFTGGTTSTDVSPQSEKKGSHVPLTKLPLKKVL